MCISLLQQHFKIIYIFQANRQPSRQASSTTKYKILKCCWSKDIHIKWIYFYKFLYIFIYLCVWRRWNPKHAFQDEQLSDKSFVVGVFIYLFHCVVIALAVYINLWIDKKKSNISFCYFILFLLVIRLSIFLEKII